MKNYYAFLMSLLIVTSATAQATYDQNDILNPTVESMTFEEGIWQDISGMTGPNMTWDFSEVELMGMSVQYSVANPAEMNGSENFPGANHGFEYSADGISIQYFMNATPFSLERAGFYVNALGFEQSEVYDDPYELFSLPMSFGNSGNDSYSASSLLDGAPLETFSGVVSYEVAGFGTIMLPGDLVFDDCLMVVTESTQENIFSGGQGSYLTEKTTYDFYVPGISTFVASFESSVETFDGATNETSLAILATSIAMNVVKEENLSFEVYPNPAQDQVTVSLSEAGSADVQIHSLTGMLVLSDRLSQANSILNVADLQAGIYMLTVHQGTSSKTQRLIVQ